MNKAKAYKALISAYILLYFAQVAVYMWLGLGAGRGGLWFEVFVPLGVHMYLSPVLLLAALMIHITSD